MQMQLQHQRDRKNVFKHIIKIQLDHNNLRRVVETLSKGASALPLPPALTVEVFQLQEPRHRRPRSHYEHALSFQLLTL